MSGAGLLEPTPPSFESLKADSVSRKRPNWIKSRRAFEAVIRSKKTFLFAFRDEKRPEKSPTVSERPNMRIPRGFKAYWNICRTFSWSVGPRYIMRLRQLTRSRLVKGGSCTRFWAAKTHRFRMDGAMR